MYDSSSRRPETLYRLKFIASDHCRLYLNIIVLIPSPHHPPWHGFYTSSSSPLHAFTQLSHFVSSLYSFNHDRNSPWLHCSTLKAYRAPLFLFRIVTAEPVLPCSLQMNIRNGGAINSQQVATALSLSFATTSSYSSCRTTTPMHPILVEYYHPPRPYELLSSSPNYRHYM